MTTRSWTRSAEGFVAENGPGLVVAGLGAAIATLVAAPFDPISPLVAAVVIGALIGNVARVPEAVRPGLAFAAKRILRFGVVLLGLRLSVGDVFDVGGPGLVVVVVTVGSTFFFTQWVGRRLGLSNDLSLLVATGFSICGASAIAAVESATDADEEEVAAAIGLVTLFGSMAIFVLPPIAHLIGLDDDAFGSWAGASVHDVAQVVATASTGGAAVVATAIVIKLTRVLLLAPIVAGVNLSRRRSAGGGSASILPLFVIGFLVMIAIRSSGVLSQGVLDTVETVEKIALSMALVGLGAGVRIEGLRRLGIAPLVLGVISWIFVAVVSLAGITLVR